MKRCSHICLFLLVSAAAGCGGVTPAGDDDDTGPDAGGDPGADSGAPDVPVLLSSIPADGAVGVAGDTDIVLTFSLPMDAASVESAYYGPSLGGVNFSWNPEQTVLTITPQAPLAYAQGTGNDPTQVAANQFQVVIGSAARSEEGVNLAANAAVSFATLRRMTTALEIDPALTRHVSAAGTVAAEGDDLRVGDTAANLATRGLISFDLAPLPATASIIESATLATRQIDTFGNPYTIDPQIYAYHVVFADLVGGFSVAPMSAVGPFAQYQEVVIEKDVTTKVADDLAYRADRGQRSQYRLQFDSDDNNDSNLDYALFSVATLELQVTYLSE